VETERGEIGVRMYLRFTVAGITIISTLHSRASGKRSFAFHDVSLPLHSHGLVSLDLYITRYPQPTDARCETENGKDVKLSPPPPRAVQVKKENRLEYLVHTAERDTGLSARVAAVVVVLGLAVVIVGVVRVVGVVGVGCVARVRRFGDVAVDGLLLAGVVGRDDVGGMSHCF